MSNTPEETTTTETTTDIPNPLGMGTGGQITKVTPEFNTANLPDWTKQIGDVFNELPDFLKQLYAGNKSTITTLGIIFGAIVGFKLTLAILAAINEIPLLAPTFELVGIGYSAWFVYRYLLQATTREELLKEINSFKSEIFGQKDS